MLKATTSPSRRNHAVGQCAVEEKIQRARYDNMNNTSEWTPTVWLSYTRSIQRIGYCRSTCLLRVITIKIDTVHATGHSMVKIHQNLNDLKNYCSDYYNVESSGDLANTLDCLAGSEAQIFVTQFCKSPTENHISLIMLRPIPILTPYVGFARNRRPVCPTQTGA